MTNEECQRKHDKYSEKVKSWNKKLSDLEYNYFCEMNKNNLFFQVLTRRLDDYDKINRNRIS